MQARRSAWPNRVCFRYGRLCSPSVAPHPASRRRSYGWLQAGVGLPEEDLHLPGQNALTSALGATLVVARRPRRRATRAITRVAPTGVRLRLRRGRGLLPSPLWGGVGVGVGRCGTSVLHGTTPHPIPLPQ